MSFSKILGGKTSDVSKDAGGKLAGSSFVKMSPDMNIKTEDTALDMNFNAPAEEILGADLNAPAATAVPSSSATGGLSLEPMETAPPAEPVMPPPTIAAVPAASGLSFDTILSTPVQDAPSAPATSSAAAGEGTTPAPLAPSATETPAPSLGGGSSGGGGTSGGGRPPKRIGDAMVEKGLISKDQLSVALHEQKKGGKLLGEIMVDLGFITADVLAAFLAESTGLQEFNPKKTVIDPEVLAMVPKKDAQKFQLIPVALDREKNEARIAMADPQDVVALDRLRQLLPKNCHILPMVGTAAAINDAIHKVYDVSTSVEAILKELAGDKSAALKNLDTLSENEAYSHPIVRLVNALVFNAVKMGASDLHFEPEESFVRLRYRIDGDLVTVNTFHREYWSGICQRLKIMAEMNIADKLSPQDGRFNLDFGGREADFRVSCLPTIHGENIVLRVLDKSSSIVPLTNLGISEHNMKLIRKCQARPEGIIIVTGPTGSGKTTTLYSMLNEINTPDVNIQTLEDPVEYSLGLIRQSQVREGGGFTFGEGVKALLRQDPDIIFVGEVRDHVTAEQALKAAMTGHQVYTSLHTNDSFGAIPRLLDLNIQPGLLAGSVIAAFAQRLVRKLCPVCRRPEKATEEECRLLGMDPANAPTIYHPAGCAMCNKQGYKGRIACMEILYMDEELDDIVAAGGSKSQLKAVARRKGFRNMLDDGIEKVLEGTTSLDALTKVLNFSDRM